jgi:hypothetical protein
MIAALILALSCMALLQFFISYCRSIIAASTARPLSEQVREVAGIRDRQLRGEEFMRLLQLTSMCPNPGVDRTAITAVRGYFRMVSFASKVLRGVIPGIVTWTEAGAFRMRAFRGRCTGSPHFA